ncbi:MAG: DUF2889 domain-containing protein [Rhodospirillaceae bacterium]
MPLSPLDVDREPIHTRAIECRSFRRSNGLWDIEGHLTDVKTYPFVNSFRGEIRPGEPIHDMWLRLTVDREFIVRAVEAVTDKGPYELCPAILPSFQKLNGLKIGPGWNRRVREALGGALGCAHLVDLLRPIATVAFHTVRWSESAPANRGEAEKPTEKPRAASRPPLNTCHVWASDGEKVRQEYPDYFSGA